MELRALVGDGGAGDYSVTFPSFDASQFVNAAGGVLGVTAQITFEQAGDGSEVGGMPASHLFLLTSIRLGSGDLTCPIPASMPFASAGFVLSSFAGDLVGAPIFVENPPMGQVCDDEGHTFLGIPFDAEPGEAQTLQFDIELTDTLPNRSSSPFLIG